LLFDVLYSEQEKIVAHKMKTINLFSLKILSKLIII